MPYPKNKYRKGYTIFGVGDLVALLMTGKWVYLNHKVYHPSFVISMQLRYVIRCMKEHRFSEAINCRDEYYKGEYRRPLPEGVTELKMR